MRLEAKHRIACRVVGLSPSVYGPQHAWDILVRRGGMIAQKERYECADCSAKPGSPTLCGGCLENRRAAGRGWIGPRPSPKRSDVPR